MHTQQVGLEVFGKLLQSVAAAALVFGTTGAAFAQQGSAKDYPAISACIKANGAKRTEVLKGGQVLLRCAVSPKAAAGTGSSLNAGYHQQIKEQDKTENLQRKQKGGMTLQNCQATTAFYDSLLQDIQKNRKFYQCDGPATASKPATPPATASKPATPPASAAGAAPQPAKPTPPAAAPAPASQPVAAPAAAQAKIKVVKALYGTNCKAAKPDVTAHVATACNGKDACTYKVDHMAIGDTAPNCAKTYEVAYECAPGKGRSASVPAEASGKTVQLGCK